MSDAATRPVIQDQCVPVKSRNMTGIISFAGETVCLQDGDDGPFYIEWHHYFGPLRVNKRGDPVQSFWGKNSPFWELLDRWSAAGKQVRQEGKMAFGVLAPRDERGVYGGSRTLRRQRSPMEGR